MAALYTLEEEDSPAQEALSEPIDAGLQAALPSKVLKRQVFSLRVFQLEPLLNRVALPKAGPGTGDRKTVLASAFSGTARTLRKSLG